jgi:antitoxin (DNA-binding transcriptional repressor) of toxin-antitoxin stability system
MTITVNTQEFAQRLDELMSLAEAGSEVLVQDGSTPRVRLLPGRSPTDERIPGLHAGQGWMADDFDAPLPPEYLPSEG